MRTLAMALAEGEGRPDGRGAGRRCGLCVMRVSPAAASVPQAHQAHERSGERQRARRRTARRWIRPRRRPGTGSPRAAAPRVCPSRRAALSMPPAAPLRARGAAAMMVRLFGAWKKPKPSPHSAMRQTRPTAPAGAREQREQQQSRGQHQQPERPEDAGGIAVREAPGDGRGERERERPGRHEQSRFDRAVSQALDLERQRDQSAHLRHERAHRGGERQREDRTRSRSNGMSGAARGSSCRMSSQPSSAAAAQSVPARAGWPRGARATAARSGSRPRQPAYSSAPP